MCVCLPVQPGQQTLGCSDQLHHGGQELVGGLMGDLAVVGGVLPALRHGAAQAVVRRSHLPHQSLQVVRLHAVVLSTNTNHVTSRTPRPQTTFPMSPVGHVIQQVSPSFSCGTLPQDRIFLHIFLFHTSVIYRLSADGVNTPARLRRLRCLRRRDTDSQSKHLQPN